ncbi:MAG: KOW domain-containing RNA-binding protein [Alicyclobacillus sp.]|nr:KOW domain-containing RNA-binding protein [Alicyclobacillus sp.]
MSKSLPEIGRIVEITQGRDRGLYVVVIGHEPDRYVWVADGYKRKAEQPKKKNVSHVRATPYIAHEVVAELRDHGKVTNARLRHAIRQLLAELTGTQPVGEEGGLPDGEGRRD